MVSVLDQITEHFISVVEGAGRFARFSSSAVKGFFTERPRRRVLMPLMIEIGLKSVPVVLATGDPGCRATYGSAKRGTVGRVPPGCCAVPNPFPSCQKRALHAAAMRSRASSRGQRCNG